MRAIEISGKPIISLAFAALSLAAIAQYNAPAANSRSMASRGRMSKVVDPEVASANAYKSVTGIPWKENLSAVLAEARKENKLVFWLQVKGQLDGYI